MDKYKSLEKLELLFQEEFKNLTLHKLWIK